MRRDSSPFVRTVCEDVLRRIFQERDFEAAYQAAIAAGRRLLAGEVPMSQLTLSKGLAASYATQQPHATVADKMEMRSGVLGRPRVGDRVQFVYVDAKVAAESLEELRRWEARRESEVMGPYQEELAQWRLSKDGPPPQRPELPPNHDKYRTAKASLVSMRAEDPGYVEEHGLRLDYVHYLERGLKSPLVDFFALYKPLEADAMFKPAIAEDQGCQLISNFAEVTREAAQPSPPAPARVGKKRPAASGKITSFFKKLPSGGPQAGH